IERLQEEKWKGNVRELQNFCERLAVLSEGNYIDIEDVCAHLADDEMDFEAVTQEDKTKNDATSPSEKDILMKALVENGYRREEAAKQLGISRTTLWRKMKQYNV